jgi:hypothetical protein
VDADTFADTLLRRQGPPPLAEPPAMAPEGDLTGLPPVEPRRPRPALSPDDFADAIIVNRGDAARRTAVANAPRSAQEAATAAQLAPQVGLPQAVVESDIPRFQTQARAQRNADLVGQHPMLAAWVAANPDSARVAQEEFDKLGKLEQLWTVGTNTAGAVALGIPEGLATGTWAANLALSHLGGAVPAAIDLVAGTDMYRRWRETFIAPSQAGMRDSLVQENSFGAKAGRMVGQVLSLLSQISITGGGPAAVSETTRGLGAVVEAVKQSTRSAAFPALANAVNTGQQVLEKTGDTAAAMRSSVGAYFDTTLQIIAPLSVAGTVGQRMASGAVTGAVTGEGGRALMNLVLPPEMQRPFDPEEMLWNAAAGGIMAGIMGPRAEPELYRAVRETYREAHAAAKAEAIGERLTAAGEIVKDMKSRDATPDQFREFMRSVSEDGDVREVWVSPKPLAEVLQQNGIDPAKIGLDRQLRDAAITGEDVRISTADFVTHISGTPAEQALLPHLKADPAGPTTAEGQAFFKTEKAAMQAQAKKIAAEKEERVRTEEAETAVRQDIVRQFHEAGPAFRSANEAYVALQMAFYRTQAERMGKTVDEIYRDAPLRIEGAAPPKKPEALVQHRKRLAVLEAIRECL